MRTKKFLSMIFCAILILTSYSTIAFADANNSEYINFISSNARIESNGSFEFKFSINLDSDRFIAKKNYISINTRAYLYRQDTGEISYDSSKEFCLVLYHDGFFSDKEVGRYYGYADGVYGGLTFYNIEIGDKYYFKLSATDGNFHLGPYYFKGYGDVSPITLA